MAAYGALAVAFAVVGYFGLFTQFRDYDDEGYIALSIKEFVAGHALYGDVYSQYGPFLHELWGGVFAISGAQVTPTAVRALSLVTWIGISLTAGFAVHRLTRRMTLGLAGALLAFAAAQRITAEALQPAGLVTLLVLGIGAAAATLGDRRPRAALGLMGALLAALVLTKINVGVFAIAAVVFALATTAPVLARQRWLGPAVAAACIGLPVILMWPDLGAEWAQDFAMIVAFGMAALAIAVVGRRPATEPPWPDSRAMLALAAGFAGGVLVMVAVILVTGTSIGDLIEGVLIEPLGQRDAWSVVAELPRAVVDLTLIGCVAAFVMRRRVDTGEPRPASAAGAIARIASGLIVLFGAASIMPIDLVPAPTVLGLAAPLAWLAACPPTSGPGHAGPFVRVLLAALALLGMLHAYPVFGSQAGLAAVPFVPVGALVLSDGLRELEASSTAWAATRGFALASVLTFALGALMVKLVAQTVVQPGLSTHKTWADGRPLPFGSANRVRLPPNLSTTYAGVVTQLRLRCDNFVSLPGMNSFYLWAGIDPPTGLNTTSWMYLLDEDQQQRIVDAVRPVRRLCAVRNDALLRWWVKGPPPGRPRSAPPPDRPLLRFINDDFRTVDQVGDYRIMVRRP